MTGVGAGLTWGSALFVGAFSVSNIAFVFPGQASQFVGMAHDLHAQHEGVRNLLPGLIACWALS